MKRKFPLLLVVLLLLSAVYTPVAYAAPGGLPSAERNDEEIDIDENDVPLIELPTADIAAEVTVDENGTAAVALSAEQILGAVESVVSGDAVRITVTATSGAENVNTVSAAMPTEALQAVVEQTDAEMEVVTDVGRMTLPNAAIASIVEKAGGEDVTFNMTRKAVELGKELLEEVLGTVEDIAEERILNGSVTEIDILSGGENITSWDGGAVTLTLPIGSGLFEQGKGYRVIQISADKSRTEHTGRCVMGAKGLHVEISITHLSTFVVLADAVEEDMGAEPTSMVASPLAARIDGGSGSSGGSNGMAYMWFAAAGLVLVASAAGGVMLKRRHKS